MEWQCVQDFWAIYISSLLGNGRQFWIAIPFGIVGTIGAKMITERTFRPKKIIKASVIYLAMLFAIYLFIGFLQLSNICYIYTQKSDNIVLLKSHNCF